ncbi:GNAT family N-acetyltransferase [Anaerosolibacter carboniphilus]|nr:GNAT family N-acetyltransferase [Anaerosolibacter carboniphilus]
MKRKVLKLKNGQSMILREAVPEDAEAMITFVNQVAGESDNLTFGPGEFAVTLDQEKSILAEFQQGLNQLFLIGEIDGEIVGNLTFRGGHRPRVAHVGEFGISVLKKYWGLGIGKYLLEYLIDWAREVGFIYKINLRVKEDNEGAIQLYRKMGFREEGRLTRDFCIDGRYYDSIAMGLQIDPEENK